MCTENDIKLQIEQNRNRRQGMTGANAASRLPLIWEAFRQALADNGLTEIAGYKASEHFYRNWLLNTFMEQNLNKFMNLMDENPDFWDVLPETITQNGTADFRERLERGAKNRNSYNWENSMFNLKMIQALEKKAPAFLDKLFESQLRQKMFQSEVEATQAKAETLADKLCDAI